MKLNRKYHIRRKGIGRGKIRRNPKGYKSIKCSKNTCPNEAVGYYSGGSWGLWLCREHGGSGTPKTSVDDIKRDPNHPSRWQLTDTFINGKFVAPRPKREKYQGKTQIVYGVVIYDKYAKKYKLAGMYGHIWHSKSSAEKWAEIESKKPFADFKNYKVKSFKIPDPSPEYGGVLGSWHYENGNIYFARSTWQGD